MADFATMQAALAAAMTARAGVTGTVWRGQDDVQPAMPYGVMSLSAVTPKMPLGERRLSVDGTCSDVKITPAVANAATYTVTIDGTPVSIVSDADATDLEIVAELVAAINLAALGVEAGGYGNGTMRVQHEDVGETFVMALSANLSYVNNDAGHEVLHSLGNIYSAVVTCEVIAADVVPPNDALSLLGLFYKSLRLDAVLTPLRAARVALHEAGVMVRLSEKSSGQLVDRATFDLAISFAQSVEERTGYIEHIEITSDLGSVDADLELDEFPIT